MSTATITQYTPASRLPLKFGKLHPGSFFRIVAEPGLGVRKSRDRAIYKLSEKGFYGENVVTGEGIVLDFEDIVQPVKPENVQ